MRKVAKRKKQLSKPSLAPLSEAIAQRVREVQIRMAARGRRRAAGVVD